MPDIDVRRNGLDPGWILALMTFPSDAKLRRSFRAVRFTRGKLQENHNDTEFKIAHELLEDLVRAPSNSDLRGLSDKQTKKGVIAGDFLLSIYAMDSFPEHFNEPSVRKAIFIAQEFARQEQFGDGSKIPTSETAIRKAFAEFRSVAHLWAAMRLQERREFLGSAEAASDFFGVAGTLQDFGCSFVPKRARPVEPLLDRNSLWSIPSSFARSVLDLQGPPEWVVETAKRYKAKA